MDTTTSQTHTSRFDRTPITVSVACPTFMIGRRLGRVHVATPDIEVEELIRAAVASMREQGVDGWTDEAEQEAVRFALWQHAENLAEYRWVMC